MRRVLANNNSADNAASVSGIIANPTPGAQEIRRKLSASALKGNPLLSSALGAGSYGGSEILSTNTGKGLTAGIISDLRQTGQEASLSGIKSHNVKKPTLTDSFQRTDRGALEILSPNRVGLTGGIIANPPPGMQGGKFCERRAGAEGRSSSTAATHNFSPLGESDD